MARFKILIKKSASKEIKKLPSVHLRKIIFKISELAGNPKPNDCIVKLQMEKEFLKFTIV